MLALIARGFTLGLTAGILPGPSQTYLIQTTLTQGWRRSLILVISPLLTDLPLILLTVFVLAQFPPEFIRVIQIVGGLFVLWLARGAWLNFRAGTAIGAGGETLALTTRQVLTRALLVNFLSPGPYIFWGRSMGRCWSRVCASRSCTALLSWSHSTAHLSRCWRRWWRSSTASARSTRV